MFNDILAGIHPGHVEQMYRDFQKNPEAVDAQWQKFFLGFDFATAQAGKTGASTADIQKECLVLHLIYAHRSRGHLIATTNPIRPRKDRRPHLDPQDFGFSEQDLQQKFYAGQELGLGYSSLGDILSHLRAVYCGNISFEYIHIRNREMRDWFRNLIENPKARVFARDKKLRILKKLTQAEVFENFLHTKYIGYKRFSVEGAESAIAGIDAVMNKSSELGADAVIVGMAHRGRLNTLANILGKPFERIFWEFEDAVSIDESRGEGDVKYHLGYASHLKTDSGKHLHAFLMPNPSHLETVDPVVEGYCRAQGDLFYGGDRNKVVPLLIHGEAAISGQGLVYEVIQYANLEGYTTGGTIHFVINNLVGFTTESEETRSADYCTSIALTTQAPVIHVNGDDVESVVFALELAAEFRMKFHHDIFIDMVCYRKYGHNETDEPRFTQPQLYEVISQHPSQRELYVRQLTGSGDIDAASAENIRQEFATTLQEHLTYARQGKVMSPAPEPEPEMAWKEFRKAQAQDFDKIYLTAVDEAVVSQVVKALTTLPPRFKAIAKAEKTLSDRGKMLQDRVFNWGMGELLAYGTLLLEGKDVRLSGQDVQRGTFSHRHAVLKEETSGADHVSLNHIAAQQGKMQVYNSTLSEYGVLGFEYGYALSCPNSLVIWEAQFGDFANGAQVMIDQYLASAETKWERMNGIVMFLPHGYEGQGPEHSSARVERYLQMCAELNMVVACCSTPANFFHLLRRHMAFPFRKPLIALTPKSLLRHPACVSKLEEFTQGYFQEVIDDNLSQLEQVKRLLVCSGKIYYELADYRQQQKINDVAIVRLEQLYPLPSRRLDQIVDKYKRAQVFWVQEEPLNMGAWNHICMNYSKVQWKPLGRKPSSSPATGYLKRHTQNQKEIIEQAFKK